MKRMKWANKHPLLAQYYDDEWCRESHDDRYLFEMLILEGFQAGLSWLTILKKREIMQSAFNEFDVDKIVKYDEEKLNSILKMPGMIKNRLKISSVVTNAHAFKAVQQEFGSFDRYIWSFTDSPLIQYFEDEQAVPAKNGLSEQISKDLKKRGFKFTGPVIVYSYLNAIGIIQDRLI